MLIRMIEKIIVLLFLVIGAVWDLKKKSVPKKYLCIWSAFVMFFLISDFIGRRNITDMLLSMIPGLVCVFLAFITREQLGYGDGWVIMLLGLFLDFKYVLKIIFVAFCILTVVIVFLFIFRKVGRRTTLPFLPFLLMGYLVCVFFGGSL